MPDSILQPPIAPLTQLAPVFSPQRVPNVVTAAQRNADALLPDITYPYFNCPKNTSLGITEENLRYQKKILLVTDPTHANCYNILNEKIEINYNSKSPQLSLLIILFAFLRKYFSKPTELLSPVSGGVDTFSGFGSVLQSVHDDFSCISSITSFFR